MTPEVIAYLKKWREKTSYEHAAMSEAKFSAFLDGLLEVATDAQRVSSQAHKPNTHTKDN